MADSTIRFRAESRLVYAYAIIALVVRARDGRDFTFGPMLPAALEEQGLTVTGPDLGDWADDFLAEVPGLHRDE